jgi:hypothetical protein
MRIVERISFTANIYAAAFNVWPYLKNLFASFLAILYKSSSMIFLFSKQSETCYKVGYWGKLSFDLIFDSTEVNPSVSYKARTNFPSSYSSRIYNNPTASSSLSHTILAIAACSLPSYDKIAACLTANSYQYSIETPGAKARAFL